MTDDLHELSALYALDVLDADERARFEEHLADCDRCSSELGSLRERCMSLAFVERAGRRRPALRDRILAAARAEPSERRPAAPSPLARGLGRRRASRSRRPPLRSGSASGRPRCTTRSRRSAPRRSVLRDPLARHIPLQGTPGRARRRTVGRGGADRRAAEAAEGEYVRGVGGITGDPPCRHLQRWHDQIEGACAARRAGDGDARACRRHVVAVAAAVAQRTHLTCRSIARA